MGQQGWEQVQRSFLWETIAKRTEEFYINMLGLQECVFCSFAFFPIIFFHVCEFNHNMDRGGASCLGSSSSISSCSWHWCRATVEVMPSLREIEKGMQCKSAHPHSVAQKYWCQPFQLSIHRFRMEIKFWRRTRSDILCFWWWCNAELFGQRLWLAWCLGQIPNSATVGWGE